MVISQDIAWSDQWLVGHQKLDEDHQDIVNIIRRMQAAPIDELDNILSQFEICARSHFETENMLMAASEFPPRQCHIDEHDAVLKSVAEVRTLLSQGLNPVGHKLVIELAKWFPAHIIHLDSALSHWLSKQQVGGKPVVIRRSLNLHHD
jgi:hemerythrin-like metal-binding protein